MNTERPTRAVEMQIKFVFPRVLFFWASVSLKLDLITVHTYTLSLILCLQLARYCNPVFRITLNFCYSSVFVYDYQTKYAGKYHTNLRVWISFCVLQACIILMLQTVNSFSYNTYYGTFFPACLPKRVHKVTRSVIYVMNNNVACKLLARTSLPFLWSRICVQAIRTFAR
jgi:hypothetical protein